jgi:glycosyl transferase family 2
MTEQPIVNPYLAAARAASSKTLYETALRTRSRLALDVLARLAVDGHGLTDVLELAERPAFPLEHAVSVEHLYALAGAAHRLLGPDPAARLYELARLADPRPIPAAHQPHYARHRLAYGADADPAGDCPALTGIDRLAIQADAAHPSRCGGEAAWLARVRRLLRLPELLLDPSPRARRFDRLGTRPLPTVRTGRLVSIIMTCHRPGEELWTAVASVRAQTWQDWELLLVDDSSGDAYRELLTGTAATDQRIRLLSTPYNVGTYRARNLALAEARGEFITGLDADDWAYPQWLAEQAMPLVDRPATVATISEAIHASDDLMFAAVDRPVAMSRYTSMMFRAGPVRDRVGFFDSVRKSADVEFCLRVAATFGERAVAQLRSRYHSLVRVRDGSLSSSEFHAGWIHPARLAYLSAGRAWHQQIRDRRADPFLPDDPPRRPFLAPPQVRGEPVSGRMFDEVLVVDCRFLEQRQRAALDYLARRVEERLAMAVVHLESLCRLSGFARPLAPRIMRVLHALEVPIVSQDEPVTARTVVVTDPAVWLGRRSEVNLRSAGEVVVWNADKARSEERRSPAWSSGA